MKSHIGLHDDSRIALAILLVGQARGRQIGSDAATMLSRLPERAGGARPFDAGALIA